MNNRKKLVAMGSGLALTMFFLGACGGSGFDTPFAIITLPDNPAGDSYKLGEPLDGLSGTDHVAFTAGFNKFLTKEDKADGLGPVFNGESCAQCHAQGAIGGAGFDLQLTRVTRIGGIRNGQYSDLVDLGGPVLQARSLREFDPSYPIPGEVVPSGAQFVSHRITTPLFGAGLIEAIPDATIIARTKMKLPDGVAGVANLELNPETNQVEVSRFGWKAQHSSLSVFAGDAYLNEMGITTPGFSTENLPQGHPIPPGLDVAADPEDSEDVELFTSFMRFLAPPSRAILSVSAKKGEVLFSQLGCANCHIPAMNTGANANPALANKQVALYSDLLVHHMGSQLADGIIQGKATGDMFRTAPLWGLSKRILFMHDGRATSVDNAILAHGGEAERAKQRFISTKLGDRTALNDFLSSL
jgi:CxxC motif-containing protein (DUF1111 family)